MIATGVRPNEIALLSLIRNKWINIGIAGIPYLGGPLQVYLSKVVDEIDRSEWDKYWKSVEARLLSLGEEKVDVDYFTSEDFIRRLRRMHSQVTYGCDETKLEYLRDYFVACASNTAIDITWRDLFLKYLSEMSGVHLLVLRVFLDRQSHLSHKDRFELPQRLSNSPICIEDIVSAMDTDDALLVEMVTADLTATGLLGSWSGEPAEPKGWSITESGLKLMHFLCDLWA